MDYQEAINTLKDEIKCSCYRNRGYCGICTIYSEMDRNKIIDACKTAISAMQELQEWHMLGTLEEIRESMKELSLHQYCGEYHCDVCALEERNAKLREYEQIGTLEEVREAMGKQKECKDCGYKIHSDRISELNSCNDCGLVNICKKRPEYGQYCRINCYDWRCRNE